MIDIETMGDRSDAAIVQIASVEFDPLSGILGREFHCHIRLDSSFGIGLKPSASTILWWLNQDQEARNSFLDGQAKAKNIQLRLSDFTSFLSLCCPNKGLRIVWGNSARFDLGILDTAFHNCDLALPWEFKNERCVRTISSLAPDIKQHTQAFGVRHNALHDCRYQVDYLSSTLRYLQK